MEKNIKFETENDLKLTIKGGKQVLVDENCCTSINIILRNDGQIMTSFLGAHNPEIIRSLEKAQKAYFKELKKTLKLKYREENCNCNTECTCGDDCNCTPEHHCGCGGHCHDDKEEHCTCGCEENTKTCDCEHNHTHKDGTNHCHANGDKKHEHKDSCCGKKKSNNKETNCCEKKEKSTKSTAKKTTKSSNK